MYSMSFPGSLVIKNQSKESQKSRTGLSTKQQLYTFQFQVHCQIHCIYPVSGMPLYFVYFPLILFSFAMEKFLILMRFNFSNFSYILSDYFFFYLQEISACPKVVNIFYMSYKFQNLCFYVYTSNSFQNAFCYGMKQMAKVHSFSIYLSNCFSTNP